jgi:UDP-3-O-[3-hydroxymyristoyl] glucosamine N-acyltransferase
LSELADIVGGELHGPPDFRVSRPVPAGDNDPTGITFAESPTYLATVEATGVGAVFVGMDGAESTKPHIRCPNPREAFGRVLAMSWRDLPLSEGIHPTAIVSQDADVHPDAHIGAFCVVEAGASIGVDVRVHPFCYVGEGCRLSEGVRLYPRVTLYRDVWLGERTIVHSGAVLGADGFGYFWDGTRHRKVPQVGGVRIGDDCEIGALTAVDRATAGETRIARGVKLDNLIQVAHNVQIGADTVIASQTGIAGSSTVGARNVFGGQCGIGDHVATHDDVSLAGMTVVRRSIKESGEFLGDRPFPAGEGQRIRAALVKLPELMKRVRQLEDELEALRSRA